MQFLPGLPRPAKELMFKKEAVKAFFVIMIKMSIKHNIPLQVQSTSSNCVQTSTSQFMSFYNIKVSPAEIEKEIPVRTDAKGNPMGTLFADIGVWIRDTYKLKVTMHVFDAQIIDRSWEHRHLLSHIENIQKNGVSTACTPYATMLIESYIKYLKAGGEIAIEKCTNDLLQGLLTKGPVLAIINFNYMYDYPRSKYDPTKKAYGPDFKDGKTFEHAILLTGYEGDNYFYNDPDSEKGGQHKVKADIIIGAICAAQINSDNYLLSVKV